MGSVQSLPPVVEFATIIPASQLILGLLKLIFEIKDYKTLQPQKLLR